MASLQFLSISHHQLLPFSFPCCSSTNKKLSKNGEYSYNYHHVLKTINSGSSHRSRVVVVVVHAVEDEFEIDLDKAKQALQNLDQQIQQLSQKQVPTPKTKALAVKITRIGEIVEEEEEEEMKEVSGFTVALITAAFFLFTVFYNIFYITVIDKP